VTEAQLREKRIDGPQTDSFCAQSATEARCVDVVACFGNDVRQRLEADENRLASLRLREPLE